MGSTLSVHEDEAVGVVESAPALVRALCCDAPLAPSERILLPGIFRLVLARGETHALTGDTLQVADGRMSTVHAVLEREGHRSFLTDRESKNGTYLNGKRLEARAELADGDVLETGHTFFVYRAAMPLTATAKPVDDLGELPTFLPELARQYERVAKIATSQIPLIVLGETGTGKEMIARAVHRKSGRSGPFVAINCGAIPATLVESELFGAKKGAFSGAVEDRTGHVRAADGGTLFLDEIGELPPPAQVALLRVLQEQEVTPIGGTKAVKVDVRFLAATHKPLDRMVDQGTFRADLYARLGGLVVRLPPLRERRDDLGLIAARILSRLGDPDVQIERRAARALFQYAFPHNIRELEKALGLAHAIARADGTHQIELDGFPDELRRPATITSTQPTAAGEPSDDDRKAHLIALLVEHHGRIADVARAMGKARMQIHRWIQRYELDLESYRKL